MGFDELERQFPVGVSHAMADYERPLQNERLQASTTTSTSSLNGLGSTSTESALNVSSSAGTVVDNNEMDTSGPANQNDEVFTLADQASASQSNDKHAIVQKNPLVRNTSAGSIGSTDSDKDMQTNWITLLDFDTWKNVNLNGPLTNTQLFDILKSFKNKKSYAPTYRKAMSDYPNHKDQIKTMITTLKLQMMSNELKAKLDTIIKNWPDNNPASKSNKST